MSLKSSLRDHCMPHVLQFLIASAETHSMLNSRLFDWAVNKLAEGVDFSDTTVSCLFTTKKLFFVLNSYCFTFLS